MLDVRRNELSWAGPAVDCVGLCGLDLGRLGSTGALGSRLSARLGSWGCFGLGLEAAEPGMTPKNSGARRYWFKWHLARDQRVALDEEHGDCDAGHSF